MQIQNTAQFLPLAQAIKNAGGQFLFVGGCVRDALLHVETKDYDAEVYGLSEAQLLPILESFGHVQFIGKSFGVFKIKGLNLDIALPRKEIKTAKGHRGFKVTTDPYIRFDEAALRRDFTINSIGFDPLSSTIIDPYDGIKDLKKQRLQATHPATFGEDPLRALRAVQFAARFDLKPTQDLCALISKQNLSELPGERIQTEFDKLLTKSTTPSIGFHLLDQTNLLRFFPEIAALKGVPQNPHWHPEGDVWIHTMMVIDYAAKHLFAQQDQFLSMLAALCHDFGKPISTVIHKDGHISSKGHEEAGIAPAMHFLERLKLPKKIQKQIAVLILHHLKPNYMGVQQTPAKEIYYLARDLHKVDLSINDLAWLGRVDAMGRTTEDAQKNQCPAVELFLEKCHTLNATDPAYIADRVTGEHLLKCGYKPGPHFTQLLEKAREIQYSEQITDPMQILQLLQQDNPE